MSEHREQSGSDHSLDLHPSHETEQATVQASPASVEPVAPQDTHAAGAATGHQHSILSDNVSGSEQEGWSEKANRLANEELGGNPGYHSTGSHTGSTGGQH